MAKAVVIGAGSVEGLVYRADGDDFVICADGGYDNAKKLSLSPGVLIGDFDSVKEVPDGIETIKLNPKKDYTDMHMAVELAVDRGFTQVDILGALGTRFDHGLANVYLLKLLYEKNVAARIVDAHNIITVAGDRMEISDSVGQTVSILPLSDRAEGITLTGFEYPLCDAVMERGVSIGISNVVKEKTAVIKIKKGLVLVISVNEK